MKIYIVSRGEQGEGSTTMGVYSDRSTATKAALEIKPSFRGGWTQDPDLQDHWTNGCDFVAVEEWDVKTSL